MYTVEIDGQKVEVTTKVFYDRLKIEAEWLEVLATAHYTLQTQGVPDILGNNKVFLRRIDEALHNVVPQITDEELRTNFRHLYWQAQKILADINKQLSAVIAKRVGLPMPETKREAEILEEMRQSLLYEETPLINDDYRQVLKIADNAIKEFRATKQQIDNRLTQRLTRPE